MSDPAKTFFHCRSAEADPQELLDPERQFTEPWGSPDHGPCDKCGGEGVVPYECRSCLERGSEAECPACEGRVRFAGTCPTCEGGGEIRRTRRRGIAVFPSREGLYRYLAERDSAPHGKMLVELRGRIGDEPDLDADSGALLVLPEAVVGTQPLDPDLVQAVRARLDDVQARADPGSD
jgi:hypothetical protein